MYHISESNSKKEERVSPSHDDVPNKGRNLILSGLVAFSAMFGYAIAAGLVQVWILNYTKENITLVKLSKLIEILVNKKLKNACIISENSLLFLNCLYHTLLSKLIYENL